MEKTTLYLTEEIRRDLAEFARRSGETKAVIIRRAISEYLRKQERPKLRSIGVGEDRELAARDSEDWLESEWDLGV